MSDEAVIDIQKENEAMSKGGKVVVREYYEFWVDALINRTVHSTIFRTSPNVQIKHAVI